MSRVFRIVTLTVIWVALWGEITAANVFWGVVVAAGVTLALPSAANNNGVRPLAALKFFVVFAGMLVASTWQVVVAVLRPRLQLSQAIVAVPLHTDDPVIVTLVANGITLTPGTLTVDVGPDRAPDGGRVLYVHALTLTSVEDVIGSAHQLEDLAIAAFPPPESPRPASDDHQPPEVQP